MRRRALTGFLVAAVLAGTGTATAASPRLALPEPTGPFPVGRSTLHLRDEARADFWVPGERRELMVSLWYPAKRPSGKPAPYLTPAESAALVHALKIPGAPDDLLTTVRTHATADAPPRSARLPLVVLSPGLSMPRATLTALGEELASRGYAVAAIGHNHEAVAITFPGGRTTGCLACGSKDGMGAAWNRAADVSFVLGELAGNQLADLRRVVMIGHSLGGASTIAAMRADPRIDAGINLDGQIHVQPEGLDRPVVLFGAPNHQPGLTPSWDDAWSGLTGWRRWLTADGAGHNAFTDHPLLAEQLGLPLPEGQTMSGARGTRLTRAYATAFADRHLRGRSGPLLDRPSERFPEVRHWS